MDLNRKLAIGILWTGVQNWGRQLSSFIIFSCLARLLTPESFGVIALSNTFLALIQLIIQQGFSTAIIQRKSLKEEHLYTAFWSNILISSLLVFATVLAAPLVADIYREPALTSVLRWLSISLLISAVGSVQEALLKRELMFKPLAIRSLVAVCCAGVVGISMAYLGYGVWSLVGYQLINSLVQSFTLWYLSKWRPQNKFSRACFKELFAFEINIIGIRIIDYFNNYADKFFIGYFLGTVALGYYEIAYKILLTLTQLFVNVINQVAMSLFSKLQGDMPQLRKSFYNSIQLTTLIAFPAFFGISLLAPELILLFFGDQWVPSISVMRVLAYAGILYSVSFLNGTILVALGKPIWRLKILLATAVVKFVGFYLTVDLGVIAIAVTFVIVNAFSLPITFICVKRLVNVSTKIFVSQILPAFYSSLMMGAVILFLKMIDIQSTLNLVLYTFILSVTCFVVYFAMLRLVSPSTFVKVRRMPYYLARGKQKA